MHFDQIDRHQNKTCINFYDSKYKVLLFLMNLSNTVVIQYFQNIDLND